MQPYATIMFDILKISTRALASIGLKLLLLISTFNWIAVDTSYAQFSQLFLNTVPSGVSVQLLGTDNIDYYTGSGFVADIRFNDAEMQSLSHVLKSIGYDLSLKNSARVSGFLQVGFYFSGNVFFIEGDLKFAQSHVSLRSYDIENNHILKGKLNIKHLMPSVLLENTLNSVDGLFSGSFDFTINQKTYDFELDGPVQGKDINIALADNKEVLIDQASGDLSLRNGKSLEIKNLKFHRGNLESKGYIRIDEIANQDVDGSKKKEHQKSWKVVFHSDFIKEVSFADVYAQWPQQIKSNVYVWLSTHMGIGNLTEATFDFEGKVGGDGVFTQIDFSSVLEVKDASVIMHQSAKEISDIEGKITLSNNKITFNAVSNSQGFKATHLQGNIIEVDGKNQIQILLDIDSDVKRIVDIFSAFIVSNPNFKSFDVSAMRGEVKSKLTILLPLETSLDSHEQAELTIEGSINHYQLKHRQIPFILHGKKLTISKHTIGDILNDGYSIAGDMQIGDIKGIVSIEHALPHQDNIPTIIHFAGPIDLSLIKHSIISGYVEGMGDLDITITKAIADNVKNNYDLSIDLTEAKFDLPFFGWSKKLEESFIIHSSGYIKPYSIKANTLSVEALDSFLDSSMTIDKSSRFDWQIENLQFGENQISGFIKKTQSEGLEIGIASKNLKMISNKNQAGLSSNAKDMFSNQLLEEILPDGKILAALDQISINQNMMHDIRLIYDKHNAQFDTLYLMAQGVEDGLDHLNVSDIPNLEFIWNSSGDGKQNLNINIQNLGFFLRAFDFSQSLYRGVFKGKNVSQNSSDGLRLDFILEDYSLRDAPFLLSLLSHLSLSAPIDLLVNDGISFSKATGSAHYQGDVVKIENWRTSSLTLGVNFSGEYNRRTDWIAIDGNVAPFYLLNNLLGSVPFIGDITTQKGLQPLLAADFSAVGLVDNPDIEVYTSTLLLPGILKNIIPDSPSTEQ